MFPQIFGKYVLERELASGGMAVVYLATLRGAGGFEKRLVVKQIRAELASDSAFVERFVAEAKTTVGLSHPNIVPVYELGVEQGVYFIAMELAQGVTLSDLLKVAGRLPPEEGAYLGVEISRALDYAHRKAGIVHRDVTPRNVLIDEEGAVRLIDFGIAAPVTGERDTHERVYGSPGHMPPEQLRGGRLTPATDVFALGALLLEAWTVEPPFRRATRSASDLALSVTPPRLSRVDASLSPLDELLARTVALEPEIRPQTAEELARPLREFLRTADLGDIARRLGDRVRRARRVSQENVDAALAAPQSTGSATPRLELPRTLLVPVTRPLTRPETETFAAREEVVEWTRPQSERPSAVVVPDAVPELARVGDPAPDRRRAALLAVAVLGAAAAGVALAWRTTPSDGDVAERTPRVGDPPPGPRTRPSDTQNVHATTPANAIEASSAATQGTSSVSVPPSAAAVSVRARSTSVASSPSERAAMPTLPPEMAPSSTTPTPPASFIGDDSKGDVGTLTFTSDLPARVIIDGTFQGTTPLRGVKKGLGRHVVSVVAVGLDERLTATVESVRQRSITVHAEFTRAAPALRIR